MPKRALVLIDIQNDYFPGGKWTLRGIESAADNAARVLAAARAVGDLVVHVRHEFPTPDASFFAPGSDGARIHPKVNVLFGHPNVICTPHLGAATTEAQENVALQVAEQMSDYLLHGAISNAVNFPSITAEEAPKLKPFIELAEKLGSFAGQLTETGIAKVQITYEGHVAEMKIKALTSAVLSGLLRPMLGDVNVVSAPVVAKERGMTVDEMVRTAHSDYESLITVTVTTERQERSVSGTVYADGKPRLVDIKGIRVDAEFGKSMIYITNEDKPGFIGHFASLLGDARINIATFHLGRNKQGGDAIALVEIDGAMPEDVLVKVKALPQVKQAKTLAF